MLVSMQCYEPVNIVLEIHFHQITGPDNENNHRVQCQPF